MLPRLVIVVLSAMLLVLQYQLWVADGGIAQLHRLQRAVTEQERENRALAERNAALAAEVRDLKHGLDAVEARARRELGMVREGETFYQVVDEPADDGPDDSP